MDRRFWIGTGSIFVVWVVGSWLVHGVLLHADYAGLPNLYRPQAEASALNACLFGAHVLLAGAFTWIYARGVESKPWLPQGLRYGAAVAFLTAIPTYTIYYAIQPLPEMMVVRQILFDSVLLLVLGAVVAFVYRAGKA